MKKKTAIYLLLGSLAAFTLTACSDRTVQEEAGGYAKATLFCDVSFWEAPVWREEEGTITGDISKRTGLALDVMQPTQDADTQLKIMLINDELPDLISVTDSVTISQIVSSGKVWKLDEFLQEYKPDSHIFQDFPEDTKKELIKRDGGWYAWPSHINSVDARAFWKTVPYMEDVVKYNDNNAIMWNRALLDEAGLTVEELQTEEQVLAALDRVKDMNLQVEGEEVIPFLVDGKSYQDPTLKYLLGTFGAEWVDDEGRYRDIMLQPQAKDALYFLNRAMRSGYASPEQLTMETQQIQELMQSGRVLCFVGNIANTTVDYREWISSGAILADSGSSPVFGKNMRATTGWISTFIARDCEHPEEIASFLDYMTSGEGLAFWGYGYEGEDYQIGEDGCYYRMDPEAANYYAQSGIGAWWMFSNTAWERSVVAQQDNTGGDEDVISTAYGRHARTVRYDSSLLIMPTDLISKESPEGRIEEEIETWKNDRIIRVVLAKDDAEFEREYLSLIQGLYDRGIEQLDAKKQEGYEQNCLEYGGQIRKVNRTKEAAE